MEKTNAYWYSLRICEREPHPPARAQKSIPMLKLSQCRANLAISNPEAPSGFFAVTNLVYVVWP
jgi:hypothetical protein